MLDDSRSWQKILSESFIFVEDLLDFLKLPRTLANTLAIKQFKMRVTKRFANRIQPENPKDPLLLQILPTHQELIIAKDFEEDPLQETNKNLYPGLIHKYKGRVLLIVTGICAINCRFCFRRHFSYKDNIPGKLGWKKVINYIRKRRSIKEVILSGGDPLLASDSLLENLLEELSIIPHLETIRIHTRIPLLLPERIDKNFLNIFAKTRLKKVMVLHCNHPQEIDQSLLTVCQNLININFHLLNQTVLLKNVNDKASTLINLSKKLFLYNIMPYYLHMLDKVAGASHFQISDAKTMQIYRKLQSELPGYLVPRLVKEESGKANKTLKLF